MLMIMMMFSILVKYGLLSHWSGCFKGVTVSQYILKIKYLTQNVSLTIRNELILQ